MQPEGRDMIYSSSNRTNGTYSFSAYNKKGIGEEICVLTSRNGYAMEDAYCKNYSGGVAARTASYKVEHLVFLTNVNVHTSITNIYGGILNQFS